MQAVMIIVLSFITTSHTERQVERPTVIQGVKVQSEQHNDQEAHKSYKIKRRRKLPKSFTKIGLELLRTRGSLRGVECKVQELEVYN